MPSTVDLIVIGGGPGGYVAAIRAAQLGFSVMCVDARSTLGGTCLNEGCIPSKALLHSSHLYAEACTGLGAHGIGVQGVALDFQKMMGRKESVIKELTQGIDFLFRKNKITRLIGQGCLIDAQTIEITTPEKKTSEKWQAKRGIILATGSEAISFPGVGCDEERILSSRGALSLQEIPKRMIVLGGGYIGLEMSSVFQRLGSQVTVIEKMDRLLPAMDLSISRGLEKSLQKQGIEFRLSEAVKALSRRQETVQIQLEGKEKGAPLEADVVLVSLGRKPFTRDLGLEALAIQTDARGFIVVDKHFQTTSSGVYAIGDVIGGLMLAHKAEDEGIALVEMLAGQAGHVNKEVIPSVIYTTPQAASVGLTEEELKQQNTPYQAGQFPFMANSRAKATSEGEGFVKILAHAQTDRVLGVHILGPDAETLIGEAALAMEFGASAEDIARTCHAHPSYSESLKEAALAVAGRAIHI